MRARWPNFWLRAQTERLRDLPHGDAEIVEAQPDDPGLVEWDAEASGRRRPIDHRFWLEEEAVPLWFQREGATIGYAYIQMRRGSLYSPEAITVGPVGAPSPEDAALCLPAAIDYARSRSKILRLAVPGPHPALPIPLEAGFHIVDIETFVSTQPFLDPERYAGSPDVF